MHLSSWSGRCIGVLVASWLAGLALAAPPRALAADFRGGGEEIVVAAGEVVNDDLYAAARRISIDGTVNGDVVVAAASVTVNGTIEGSLIAAAQSVIINGRIRDSARVATQATRLEPSAAIGRDLIFGGYSLNLQSGSSVGRDLVVGGYQTLLGGAVGRNFLAGANAVEIAGKVGGDVKAHIGAGESESTASPFMSTYEGGLPRVLPGLTVTDTATIGGALIYTAARPATLPAQPSYRVAWTPDTETTQPAQPPGPGAVVADVLRTFVALAIVGLLLVWLVPRWVRRLADLEQTRPVLALGWGVVAAAIALAAAFLLFLGAALLAGLFGVTTLHSLMAVTIVGGLLGEAVLGSSFVVYTALIAKVIIAYLVGRWLLTRFAPTWAANPVAVVLVGLVVYVLVAVVPILGGVLGFAAGLLALGAGWMWAQDALRPPPSGPALAPPAAGPTEVAPA